VEVAVRITGNLAGKAAKILASALKSASQNQKGGTGRDSLARLVASGEKIDIAQIMDRDLRNFCREARKYGASYTVLKDRDLDDGMTELVYRTVDREKIARVMEKAGIEPVFTDTAAGCGEKSSPDILEDLDDIERDAERTEIFPNPGRARGEKENPSARFSGSPEEERDTDGAGFRGRKSVREELREIREEMKKKESREKGGYISVDEGIAATHRRRKRKKGREAEI